jgi:hypothetical protein
MAIGSVSVPTASPSSCREATDRRPEPVSLGLGRSFDSLTELFRDDPGMLGVGGEPLVTRPSPALSDLDRGTPIDEFFVPRRTAPAELGPAAAAAIYDIPENWAAGLQDGASPASLLPSVLQTGRACVAAFDVGRPAHREPPPRSTAEPQDPVASPAHDEQAQSSPGRGAPFDPVAVFCAAADLDPKLLADGAAEDIIRKAG